MERNLSGRALSAVLWATVACTASGPSGGGPGEGGTGDVAPDLLGVEAAVDAPVATDAAPTMDQSIDAATADDAGAPGDGGTALDAGPSGDAAALVDAGTDYGLCGASVRACLCRCGPDDSACGQACVRADMGCVTCIIGAQGRCCPAEDAALRECVERAQRASDAGAACTTNACVAARCSRENDLYGACLRAAVPASTACRDGFRGCTGTGTCEAPDAGPGPEDVPASVDAPPVDVPPMDVPPVVTGPCGQAVFACVCRCGTDVDCAYRCLNSAPAGCLSCVEATFPPCCPTEGAALSECRAEAMRAGDAGPACTTEICVRQRCLRVSSALTQCYARQYPTDATCRRRTLDCASSGECPAPTPDAGPVDTGVRDTGVRDTGPSTCDCRSVMSRCTIRYDSLGVGHRTCTCFPSCCRC